MLRTGAVLVAMTAALVVTTGCAGVASDGVPAGAPSEGATVSSSPTPGADRATPPMSSTVPPTLRPPTGPPKTPSDQQPVAVVVGRVVRGGPGPCYGVETDDGKVYAMYSTSAGQLATGTTVRVTVEPLKLRIYCGPGEHVAALRIEVV